jgi:hypothetical protein
MSDVSTKRAAYIRAVVAERKARSRLIFRRKQGRKAIKLRRLLARKRLDRRKAKKAYVAAKATANAPMRLKALADAGGDVGVTESGGNNRGPAVEAIIRKGGGSVGDAWCLWAVIKWYRAAGSTANWSVTWGGVRNIRYVEGVKRVLVPLAGHVIEYTFEHTGLFVCFCNAQGQRRPRLLATHLKAIEANTGNSGAVSDSVTGGDGVKEKIRPKGLVLAYYKVTK